ncbi:unnamed protein product, partial [marine sediment metagenome]
DRAPLHFFFTGENVVSSAALALVLLLLMREQTLPALARRICFATLIMMGFMCALNLLGVYILQYRPLVLLHPLRADTWAHLAMFVCLPAYLWLASSRNQHALSRVLLLAIAGLFMVGPVPEPLQIWLLALLVALVVADRQGAWSRWPDAGWRLLTGLALAVAVVVLALQGARVAVVVVMLAVLGGIGSRWLSARSWGLLGLVLFVAVLNVVRTDTYDIASRHFLWYQGHPDAEFRDIAHWAKENTDAATGFITPPWLAGWRCLSQRSTLIELK